MSHDNKIFIIAVIHHIHFSHLDTMDIPFDKKVTSIKQDVLVHIVRIKSILCNCRLILNNHVEFSDDSYHGHRECFRQSEALLTSVSGAVTGVPNHEKRR